MPRLSSTRKLQRSQNRERVVELMAAGQTTRQISQHIGVPERTVWKLWAEAQEISRSSSRLNIITVKAQRRSQLEFLYSALMQYVVAGLNPTKLAASGMTHRDLQGYVNEAAKLNAQLIRLDGLEGTIAPPVNPFAGPNEGNMVGDEAENDPKRAKELLDFIYKDGEKHPDLVAAFQKYYPACESDADELDAAAKDMYGEATDDEPLQPTDDSATGGGVQEAAGGATAASASDVPEPVEPHATGHDTHSPENE